MLFKVTKQYARGAEIPLPTTFNQVESAKAFVYEQLQQDATLSIKAIYRIYNAIDDLMGEFDPNKLDATSLASKTPTSPSTSGTGGATSTTKPTPFSIAPRPAGMLQPWQKVEPDDKKK